MATFLKEYPFMSQYYYWNVLTLEMRTIMLSDAVSIKYKKNKKKDDVEIIKAPKEGNISEILGM